MLVGRIVVADQMHIEIGRHVLVDMTEEGEEFLVPMTLLALRDHFPVGCVEGSEQRCRTVADVVVSNALDITKSHRKNGLGAFERLALALFVHTENQGVFRRIQVEPDDVTYLLDEERIIRELCDAAASRRVGCSDEPRSATTQFLSPANARSSASSPWLVVEHGRFSSATRSSSMLRGAGASRCAGRRARFRPTLAPQADRGTANLVLIGEFVGTDTVGRSEHDPGPRTRP